MQLLLQFAAVLLGSFVVAFGVDAFLAPYRLIDGGFIGIGLLLNYHFGILPGLTVLLISTPVFIGVFFYDRTLFLNAVNGLLITSLLIDVMSPVAGWFRLGMPAHALLGGWLIGMGVGTMLAYRTNSGGTDLLGQIAADRTGIPAAVFILLFDVAVLMAGLQVIGFDRTIFSLLTILIVFAATWRYSRRKPLGRSIHVYMKKN
ncbi:YitT family protein [Paenibacillus mesophilus]|uniref:YitT family protein n=1 Tax=Paenibacillus mesophilus TaxID=2582849 RepID=UPI00110EF0DA|nr:YitT family protein [Paenibacillus mesophilus]TMV44189.1 YitT family protein [Paenibacillus mesophilus]